MAVIASCRCPACRVVPIHRTRTTMVSCAIRDTERAAAFVCPCLMLVVAIRGARCTVRMRRHFISRLSGRPFPHIHGHIRHPIFMVSIAASRADSDAMRMIAGICSLYISADGRCTCIISISLTTDIIVSRDSVCMIAICRTARGMGMTGYFISR